MFSNPFLVNPSISSLSPVQSFMSRNRLRAMKAMFIFLPPTLVDFSGEFVYIFLGRLAFGNKFLVPQVVQKSLKLLDTNISWQFYDYCVCRAFDSHDKLSSLAPKDTGNLAIIQTTSRYPKTGEMTEMSTLSRKNAPKNPTLRPNLRSSQSITA